MITVLDVLGAVGARIDEVGAGFWQPSGAYPQTPPRPPVYGKRFPVDAPDTAISLNVYGVEVGVDPKQPTRKYRVQVRCRAPLVADPLADTIMGFLHGAVRETWGEVRVQLCHHVSTAQMGVDENSLDERTDNYEIEVVGG